MIGLCITLALILFFSSAEITIPLLIVGIIVLSAWRSGDRKALAIDLEDSAIIVAPLIPWSIAGGAPLSAIGAPHSALLFAFYLYLLPLARLAFSFRAQKREKEGFA